MKRYLLVLFVFLLSAGLMAQIDAYKPTLKSPANAAENQVPNVILSWNAITGSLGLQYQIQLDTAMSFNSPLLVDTTLLLLTGYTTHELIFGQTYYWRVRSKDQGQTSVWSDVWNFKVFNKVVLAKPANNAQNRPPNPYLNWKTTVPGSTTQLITGVKYYNYQLDVTPDFNSPDLWEGTVAAPTNPKTIDTIYVRASRLYFGTKYYWRVCARHDLSTSSWTEPFYFTVATRDSITVPANGTGGNELNARMKWRGFTGLLAYEYELARDPNFTNIIAHNEVDTNFTFASLTTFGTKYYLRVRGRHQKDTLEWSFPINFTTVNTIIKSKPDSAGMDVNVKPLFTWKALNVISGYQLQVDSMINFPSPILDIKPTASDVSYQLTKKLNPMKTYYWRMRAFSNFSEVADTTAWSPVWPFTTASSIGMDEPGLSSFSIFPNPAKDKITLRIDLNQNRTASLVLVDLLGKTLITSELNLINGSNTREISLDNINKGIYILRLTLDGQTLNRKLIVD